MPGVDHPVHFLRSAPFHVESGLLLFYDVVEISALSRSNVLSCIAEAEGEAQLPNSVTVSDFRKWLAAVSDSQSEFQAKPFSFMCTVIKVADAVDDKHIDEFVGFAAKTLVQNTSPSSSKDTKLDILDGISLLPDHLQSRVFAAAVAHPQDQDALINFLPAHLHATLLSSNITPGAMLPIHLGGTWSSGLEALASLPASPPSVMSLFVDIRKAGWRSKEQDQKLTSQLIQALRHHTALTSLQLQSATTIATAPQLIPPIAQLTALRLLNLEQLFPVPVDVLPALKHTLTALPLLHTLYLHLSKGARFKRQRDSQQIAGPPQVCLADLLSPVTALTCLSLRVTEDPSRPAEAAFKFSKPPSLPHLRDVSAIFDSDLPLTASFFHRLEAPLSSIRIADGLQQPTPLAPEAAPLAHQLLRSLAAFTHLRSFTAKLPTDASAPSHSSIFDAVTAGLPPLLSAFSQLEECTLAVEPAVAHLLLPQLADAAPALTQLRLGFWHPDEELASSHSRPFTAAWQGIFTSLRQLKLQHLHLDFEEDHAPPGHGLDALQPLTQLTALLVPGWSCLSSSADWQALASMTSLQDLCLDQTTDWVLSAGSVASLRALTRLTSLTIKTCDKEQRLVPALAAHLPPQSLPQLQELTLAMFDPFRGTMVLRDYAAALPALRKLTVHLLPSSASPDTDSDFDPDDEEMHPHAEHLGRVSEACRHLRAAAKQAAGSRPHAGLEVQVDTSAIRRYL